MIQSTRFKLKQAIVAASLVFSGCVRPPQAGPPVVLTVPDNANPDAIWIVRPVSVEHRKLGSSGRMVLYGLFACYRMKTPEAPKCFLAKTDADADALVWPDRADAYSLPAVKRGSATTK